MKFKTHAQLDVDTSGVMSVGTISATAEQLRLAFGEPLRYADHVYDGRTTTEWKILFEDGTVAAVYDYRHLRVAPGTNPPMPWSIAGTSRLSVELVHQRFREALGLGSERSRAASSSHP